MPGKPLNKHKPRFHFGATSLIPKENFILSHPFLHDRNIFTLMKGTTILLTVTPFNNWTIIGMVVQYRNASYILRQYTVHAYNALWTPTNRDFL